MYPRRLLNPASRTRPQPAIGHYDAFTTTTFAKSAFRCSAPAVWNSLGLPKTVINSDSVFKSRLKTFLFSQAFYSASAY